MDKKRRTRKLILIGSAIVILGVAGYFGYKWWKDKQDKKDEKPPDDSSGGGTDLSGGGGGGGSVITPNPFKTSDELKKFQKWVIDVAKDSAILGASLDDGKWGKNSANAWTKYGERYQKETGAVVSSTKPKGVINGMYAKKTVKTFGGTPNSPTDLIEYKDYAVIGAMAYKDANGNLTFLKTSDDQKVVQEKGKAAWFVLQSPLLDYYYMTYYDYNTKTYRYIQFTNSMINEFSNYIGVKSTYKY